MKTLFLSLALFLIVPFGVFSQSTREDIPAEQLPASVRSVLETYVAILKTSPTLEEAGASFTKIAGGGLVNEALSPITLRQSILPFSLKKDYSNIKFYAEPIQITRINAPANPSSQGFGATALRGRVFKIWIAKKPGVNGMPAPISILVPEGHPSIVEPKVVGIGSL